MDGFELDADELVAVARRPETVAALAPAAAVSPVGHDRLDAALDRFGVAWARGHRVLTSDAAAAGAGLRGVVTSTRTVDGLVAERLLGLR